jgi:hypothetical protein
MPSGDVADPVSGWHPFAADELAKLRAYVANGHAPPDPVDGWDEERLPVVVPLALRPARGRAPRGRRAAAGRRTSRARSPGRSTDGDDEPERIAALLQGGAA